MAIEKSKRIIEIKDYDLQVFFIGDEKEVKIAKDMLNDLLTRPSIQAIFVEDVKKIINDKPRRLAIYSFEPPFNADDLKKFIGESDGIIYAIYGNQDLSMKQINSIYNAISELSPLVLGAPFMDKTKSNTIKVMVLI